MFRYYDNSGNITENYKKRKPRKFKSSEKKYQKGQIIVNQNLEDVFITDGDPVLNNI